MSLYGEYIKEREGKGIVESEVGFATYIFNTDNSCYIVDIYVKPEHRRTRAAYSLGEQIAFIAKERGCNKLYGSVVPSLKNSTESLKFLIACGFKLDKCQNDFIVVSREF